ncbi:MAG: valine--tRNA ligase [Lentisphaerae bacterium]|nr:valine--tRNA ligase [Lentisphaerota bacterium]MBT4821569.1 valine--tRNA ligase [Lentisphaerota bacterium]MBT5604559.1 valine--tRNA ligase [Lentisphaerota bacterium]MBT7061732.1 valine--tRNA ligase [Lentisphaerota bacterium]MBT7848810.1 valine--tRNA ligase [Lentisphaerota bacterium]
MSSETMAKAYSPAEVEAKWYGEWESRGHFRADPTSGKQPYTIVIPPPNVTGMLTLGHVLNNTLQDILIRWEKMRGREACWVPGTDHAGIATQAKVEAHLRETEGVTRYDLGREAFLERVWQWKEKYGGTIIQQLRRIGCACDWERERFTLDEGLSDAVLDVFIRLYEKGLIYKGHRIINWCPKSRTALSDEEVIYKELQGHLWYFQYPLSDGSAHITVATTRPETMLGDTGVAVHPEDPRYKPLLGKTVTLPLVNREIPIIGDEFVDPEFGTGAVKVTPAHDPNDYEMGLRHDLPMINVMNDDGSMNEAAGDAYRDLSREDCRKAVLADLEKLGLLQKTEDYVHQVGFSERGYVPVEPRLSEQWFVKMKPLAEPALNAVTEGRIRFHPERWTKTYRHWMENIRDWCISRQLWWGHRIPAYYCQGCEHIAVAKMQPECCPECGSTGLRQDEDVLDTWFSSWLWPFSVLGWPEDTPEQAFYPTNSLVTGPDIIFFWVARMIMAGIEFKGEIPFEDVYFTSIIRDEKGQKMSKSLNNSPDPLDVVATYGADALRFTMVYIAPVGQDIRYSNEKCELGRNFANKIWNAARFRMHQGDCSVNWQDLSDLSADELRPDDRWILARANDTVRDITDALANFRFHEIGRLLYEFIWNEFCDWYLESAKAVFNGPDDGERKLTLRVFDHVMATFLRLLHPVMPFVTEELSHHLGFLAEDNSIMDAEWPAPLTDDELARLGATSDLVTLVTAKFEMIRAVRNVRGTYLIPPAKKVAVVVAPSAEETTRFLSADLLSLKSLLYASEVTIDPDYEAVGPTGVALGQLGTAYIPLADVIDVSAERERLEKQQSEALGFIDKAQRKLDNEGFVSRAPADVVQRERDRLLELRDKLSRIGEQLTALQ